MGQPRIYEKRDREILEAWKSGELVTSIAKRYDIGQSRVSLIVKAEIKRMPRDQKQIYRALRYKNRKENRNAMEASQQQQSAAMDTRPRTATVKGKKGFQNDDFTWTFRHVDKLQAKYQMLRKEAWNQIQENPLVGGPAYLTNQARIDCYHDFVQDILHFQELLGMREKRTQ